jgi:hypothetical protein
MLTGASSFDEDQNAVRGIRTGNVYVPHLEATGSWTIEQLALMRASVRFARPEVPACAMTLVAHAGFCSPCLGGKLAERDESTVPTRLTRNVC